MPEISIIIPVYNRKNELPLCLDSVLAQTFADWEVICINDGSTDGSAEILSAYAARDSRIRVFTQENRGQGAARNYGIHEARGKYISFLDSDDYLASNFLEALHTEAQRSGADVVVGSTSYESARRKGQIGVAIGTSLSSFTERVAALPHGGPCDKLYDSELLRQHNIRFSEGVYWEDNPFAIKVCFHALKLSAAPAAVYHYVLSQESTTRGIAQTAKRKTDSLIVAREIISFCADKGCSEKERSIVVAFCLRNFISIENLIDPTYYEKFECIFGSSQQLALRRRKALCREKRRKLYNRFKRIFPLRLRSQKKTK